MGASVKIKKEFLFKNPKCCFCGGENRSEEPDHIPSRAFFNNRQWPEGYIFPACNKCNQKTRYDEQIVAMLSLLHPDHDTGTEEESRFKKLLGGVGRHHPEVLLEMQASRRQVRDAIKKYGINVPAGMGTDKLPLISVNGPLINKSVEQFGRKLFCALYYKHTGEILTSNGGIVFRWYSNIQINNEEIPRELSPLLKDFSKLERNKTDLEDQFFYRSGITENGEMAAFLAFFRGTFAILGFVSKDASKLEPPDGMEVHRPFLW